MLPPRDLEAQRQLTRAETPDTDHFGAPQVPRGDRDRLPGYVQDGRQKTDQLLVGSPVHRRGGDSDSELVTLQPGDLGAGGPRDDQNPQPGTLSCQFDGSRIRAGQ
jgi:hypothetical protein